MCDTEDFWTVWRVLLSAPSCCRVVPWIAVIKLQRLGHRFLRAAAIHTPEIFIHLMQLLSSTFTPPSPIYPIPNAPQGLVSPVVCHTWDSGLAKFPLYLRIYIPDSR